MSSRCLVAVFGVVWACAAATCAGVKPAAPGKDAPAPAKEGKAPPAKEGKEPAGPPRLALPPGWTVCDVPMLGFRAYVPPGFMVRLRSDRFFCVERPPGVAAAAAWMMPYPLKKGSDALKIAETTNEFFTQKALQYHGEISDKSTPERGMVAYTAAFSGQPCEGRFITTLAAKGSMGYAIGAVAAQGRLAAELPVLDYVAKSFDVYSPRAQWQKSMPSPGGGILLDLPKGWKLETSEGKLLKNEVDWMAYDPKSPAARAFSVTPKFCTAELAPKLSYKGYRVGSFASPEQCIQTSLALYYPEAKVTAAFLNAALTQAIGERNAEVNRFFQQLQAGEKRGAVYDCEAMAPAAPAPLKLFFTARIDTLVMARGAAPPSLQTDVWLKGWAAPADQFLALTPVLGHIADSMEYSPEYRAQVFDAEAGRAKKVRETDAYCRKVEAEIWRKRMATTAYINATWYDFFTGKKSRVNPQTGEVESLDESEYTKNSEGQDVLKKDAEEAGGADNAPIAQEPDIKDYMDGGRDNIDLSR